MKRYNEVFQQQLEGFYFETLENDSSCIYGLTDDLRLSYMNPAWYRFTNQNSAEPGLSQRYRVGTHIETVFSEPLKSFYINVYQHAIKTGQVWSHDYDCSSDLSYRIYHQTVYPLKNHSGLIVVNSMQIEYPPSISQHSAINMTSDGYTDAYGLITGCTHCKRVRRVADSRQWDSVPQWKQTMPANMSHSLCAICYDYFYNHLHAVGV